MKSTHGSLRIRRSPSGEVRWLSACILFGWLSPVALPVIAQDSGGLPRLTYTKVLKGSVPEYTAIVLDSTGSGTYEGRKLDELSTPRSLRLSASTTRRLFDLADQLDYFQSIELESHKKVANLGLKTLAYESNGRKHQAEFNYTLRREAEDLVDLFEKVASVEQHISELEYAIKYDHLSLPRELLQIQVELNNKSLAEAELMVPTLEQIVRDPRFLHLAQARAQSILQRLQAQGLGTRN